MMGSMLLRACIALGPQAKKEERELDGRAKGRAVDGPCPVGQLALAGWPL